MNVTPATGNTARMVPELPGGMPLQAAAHILWQR